MDTMTKAAADVLAERRRQIEAEGYDQAHDDEHAHGELADAAACYALQHGCLPSGMDITGDAWPFEAGSFRPGDRRRDLVKAGALILAEIERLDRIVDTRATDPRDVGDQNFDSGKEQLRNFIEQLRDPDSSR